MLELVVAGGWLMIVILLCSVVALAICIERLYALNPRRIAPPQLSVSVWEKLRSGRLGSEQLRKLRESSPLGRILAAGLANAHHGREVMNRTCWSDCLGLPGRARCGHGREFSTGQTNPTNG